MEYLSIQNFLTIKSAELEVKKINILIGEQSTGKSIIAKVLYFFQDIIFSNFVAGSVNHKQQRQIKKDVIDEFERLFPRYTWNDQEFKLTYKVSLFELIIERKKNQSGRSRINFFYNEHLKRLYINAVNKAKRFYKGSINEIKDPRELIRAIEWHFWENSGKYRGFQKPFFISASRSFFTNLQQNVFSFLSKNIEIDPLMSEFGSYYETAKNIYQILNYSRENLEKFLNNKFPYKLNLDDRDKLVLRINEIFQRIINGVYINHNEKDWIYIEENKRINLINASSGQQESLPMLLVLSTLPLFQNWIDSYRFFIEEPEAHLFPFAQKDIVKLLTLLYQEVDCSFFITTHSPYILTAFNNLIMAENVKQETGQEIEGCENTVKYEDVAAYTIKDGTIENILDDEVKLIGTSILDSVSDVLNEEFDHLIDKQLNS